MGCGDWRTLRKAYNKDLKDGQFLYNKSHGTFFHLPIFFTLILQPFLLGIFYYLIFMILYARHYDSWFIYFLPHFWRPKSFLRSFFRKILTLYTFSIQEQFIIKSGLWWRTFKDSFLSRFKRLNNFFVASVWKSLHFCWQLHSPNYIRIGILWQPYMKHNHSIGHRCVVWD